MKKLFGKRIFKFLIGGGVSAAFNLLLIFLLIDVLGFKTDILQNLANAISIELSLVFSFFVSRIWVWPGGTWTIREVLLRQLPLYHIAAGTAVLSRIFVVFPLLNWLGVNYQINTLVGVLLNAVINYVISDRLVFKTQLKHHAQQSELEPLSELYYQEGYDPTTEFG